jgi:cardiolipin synthase A/B
MVDALATAVDRLLALPHLGWYLSLAWGAYLLLLAGWIVLQKREPAATLSWVLSLAALPFIGFLVYYLLGPQRIRRHRLKRLRARAALASSLPSTEDHGDSADLARLGRATTGFSPTRSASVKLLVGGARTFDALLEAIDAAQHHVHLEYYIFEPDRTGTRVRDALTARACAGVRVRLLLDAVGSARLSNAFLAPLRAAGAEIAWFHPFRLRRLRRPKFNLRNHRKLLIVDGRIGFAGGINITDEQSLRVSATAYHDLHLRLEGEVVRWLQVAFLEDWSYAAKVALRDDRLWPALDPGDIPTLVLPSGPDSPWEAIHRLHIEAITRANTRVWLVTPYFVPTEAARYALTSAALRGLDVRVMVPRSSDSRVVSFAARSYFDELLAAGVKVFEYVPRMLHSKALLVDEDMVLIGSANFDNRSFRLNFELSLLLLDRELASELESVYLTDLREAREVLASRRRAGLPVRLAEACARLLSPLL